MGYGMTTRTIGALLFIHFGAQTQSPYSGRDFCPYPSFPCALTCYHLMTTVEVQCFGCNRKFSPHRFSQHVSKTPNSHCCTSSAAGEVPLVTASGSIHCTAFPLSLGSNLASQDSGRVSPKDFGMYDYGLDGCNDETDMRDDTQSPGSRVRPNDLGGRDDDSEMDRHDGMQSLDGEYNSCCRLKPHRNLTVNIYRY